MRQHREPGRAHVEPQSSGTRPAKFLQDRAGALLKRVGARPAGSVAATGLWGSEMGKVTGFLEIDRADRRYAPASDRIRHYREFMLPLSEEATRNQAARCMNCGIPYCHIGCPVNNQIPDWNDLAYRGDWRGGGAQSALDQQLSGIHRPRLPRALRGVLHAQHPGHAGHDQDDRMRDYRPRFRRRMGEAGAFGSQDRQEDRRRRIGAVGPRLRPAARARRP